MTMQIISMNLRLEMTFASSEGRDVNSTNELNSINLYNCITNRRGEVKEMKKTLLCDITPLFPPLPRGELKGGMIHQLKTGVH